MRMGCCLGDRQDWREACVTTGEDFAPLGACALAENSGQTRFDLVALRRAVLAHQFVGGDAQFFVELLPEPGFDWRDRHVRAVRALIDIVVGGPAVDDVGAALKRHSARSKAPVERGHERQRTVDHSYVDDLAHARALTRLESRQHAHRQV